MTNILLNIFNTTTWILSLSLTLSPNPVYLFALSQLLKQTSLFTVVGEMPLLCLHNSQSMRLKFPLWVKIMRCDVQSTRWMRSELSNAAPRPPQC